MQTRPQRKLTDEEIAKKLENLTPEERAELESMKAEWEMLQSHNNKSYIQLLREYDFEPEEKEAFRGCAIAAASYIGLGALGTGFMGDVWLSKIKRIRVTRARLIFLLPSSLFGAVGGAAFGTHSCMARLTALPTPLGEALRQIAREREQGEQPGGGGTPG
jgi:hypothetical protein